MAKGFALVIFKYVLFKSAHTVYCEYECIHTQIYSILLYCAVLATWGAASRTKTRHLYVFPCYRHVLPSIWLKNSKTDLMISLHPILFGYYYTSFIKALSLTLFWALISNSIRVEWSMTEYLKFWGGGSQTFLAVSNFLPVWYVCNMREIPYQIHLAFL